MGYYDLADYKAGLEWGNRELHYADLSHSDARLATANYLLALNYEKPGQLALADQHYSAACGWAKQA